MTSHPDAIHCDSKQAGFAEWYERYTAAIVYDLGEESPLIKAVKADELDADFIEQRIRDAARKFVNNDAVTSGFCINCHDLFDNWPTLGRSSVRNHDSPPDSDEEGWEHAVARSCSTFELEALSRLNCRFCTFLLQNLKDCKMLETFRKVETRVYHFDKNVVGSLSIQNWGANTQQLLWLNLPGKVCTSCNDGMAPSVNFTSCLLPADADCYDDPLNVLDIAANWFSDCTKNHENCSTDGDSKGTLPTRLISIAQEPPRLVLSSECPERPKYATLSHSWGSHEVIKLTSRELESYMETLPVERLPTTFKHAIEITQKLGIDYLWIDSLCIIQDSEADWQIESSLMNSVYGGSAITIAASSARDSTHGCFLRPSHFSGGLRARITDGGRQSVRDFRGQGVYDLSTFDTHLGTRAWALQEKMLPARTIHFGDRGAFWECRSKIASEDLPDGFPNLLVSPLVNRNGGFEGLWAQIVRLYSAANLTFGKDKLPALSGVARCAFNETGDQYLAGLWRKQAEEQLCWHRLESKPNVTRPTWRAPTWSWASIDGRVNWHPVQEGVLDTQYAHVLDASVNLYGPDPFGQITSGMLRLGSSSMVSGYLVSLREPRKEGFNVMLHANDTSQEFPIQIDCLDEVPQTGDEPVFLLPILGGQTGTAAGLEMEDLVYEYMIQGIVLRPTGVTKGEFYRIGFFNYFKDKVDFLPNDNKMDEVYDSFLEVLEEHGTATAEEACAEILSNPKRPDERYVITLV